MIYKAGQYLFLAGFPAAIAGAGISTHYVTRTVYDRECGKINAKLLESNILMCRKLNELGHNEYDCNGVSPRSK